MPQSSLFNWLAKDPLPQPAAVFTGAISGGTTLTVNPGLVGTLTAGQSIVGTGTVFPTILGPQVSGTPGGAGVYTISPAQTPLTGLASTTYTANPTSIVVVPGDSTSTEVNDGALFPEMRAWTSPGAEWGNSAVISFGVNGTTADIYSQDTGVDPTRSIPTVIAMKPDLAVICFGINDMRANGHSPAQLKASLSLIVNRILAGSPTTDIVLRIPNPLGTTDIGSQGFVQPPNPTVTGAADNGSGAIRLTLGGLFPTDLNYTANMRTGDVFAVSGVGGTIEANGSWPIAVVDPTHIDLQGSTFVNAYTSGGAALGDMPAYAQRYTDEIRAVYLSLQNVWPNVIVVDIPTLVFGTTCLPNSPGLQDQLHPSQTLGYSSEARWIVWASSRKQPFSRTRAQMARLINPTAPWTIYPREVEDPSYYTSVIKYGRVPNPIAAGAPSFAIDLGQNLATSLQAPYSVDPDAIGTGATERDTLSIMAGDFVQAGPLTLRLPTAGAVLISGTSFLQLQPMGSAIPANIPANVPVTVWRSKYYHDTNLQQYMDQTRSWPSRYRVLVSANTANAVTFTAVPGDVPIWQHQPEAGNVLIVPGNAPIVLAPSKVLAQASGITIQQAGGNFNLLSLAQGFGYGFVFSPKPQKVPEELARGPIAELVIPGPLSSSLSGQAMPARVPGIISAGGTVATLSTDGTTPTVINLLKNSFLVATISFPANSANGVFAPTGGALAVYVTTGDSLQAQVVTAGTGAGGFAIVLNN